MPPRLHLKYLDGLRGLAALYVVIFHLISTQETVHTLSPIVTGGLRWLRYGHFAVDLFIVLSGFCLMLPVARSDDGRLPGGMGRFFYRRGRRILPPLWAALAFTLAMILAARVAGGRVRADDGSVFDPGNLLTHALLIHNWFPAYSGSINLPMWTVAVEWQIYFLFPFLLLPLWRRLGSPATIVIASTIGLLPLILLPTAYNFSWTRPWYLGLFAMGMAAAACSSRGRDGVPNRYTGWTAAIFVVAIIVMEAAGGADRAMTHLWAKDLLVGAAAACMLAYLAGVVTDPAAGGRAGRGLARGLQSRPVVLLGAFSYSIYLIHLPLMWGVKFVVQAMRLSPPAELAFRLTLAPAAIAAAAFAFYWVFERPFVSANAPPTRPAEATADRPGVVTVP